MTASEYETPLTTAIRSISSVNGRDVIPKTGVKPVDVGAIKRLGKSGGGGKWDVCGLYWVLTREKIRKWLPGGERGKATSDWSSFDPLHSQDPELHAIRHGLIDVIALQRALKPCRTRCGVSRNHGKRG